MSAFSESALERKLLELSNSQQSVQTLSLWLIHHRKHSPLIVTVWERELRKGEGGAGESERAGQVKWGQDQREEETGSRPARLAAASPAVLSGWAFRLVAVVL